MQPIYARALIKNYARSFWASQIKPLGGAKIRCISLTLPNANSKLAYYGLTRRSAVGHPRLACDRSHHNLLSCEPAARWRNVIRALIAPAPRGTTITGKKA
jgi:hypothetical protein